ncbi:SET domain-containing protein [Stipitochalara longipes BDJ]|nr:SET domain-containing protein [Stipitochalara longipes BDJ]
MQEEVQQGGDGIDKMADAPASRDGLYTIEHIMGKGLGFVATSKISNGTRILLERPLFKAPGSTEDISSAEIIVLREVKSLTKEQQLAFFALQNVQGRKCTPELGIVITNMLPLGESNGGGLFLKASRINHSCQPNAQHAWNDVLGHLTVHALRDIEADDEITISYISGVSPGYAERQRHLMDAFSFSCACELCSLPLPARAGSDYRLEQIRSINEDDGAATDLVQVLERPAKSFNQVHRLFGLLEEEGICDIRVARACFNAFQIAAVVGDKARAKVFAERAYAARKVLAGDDNPTTIEFKHLARRPVDYHLYGTRIKCYDDSWEAPRGMHGEELENWLWNTDGWSRHSFS